MRGSAIRLAAGLVLVAAAIATPARAQDRAGEDGSGSLGERLEAIEAGLVELETAAAAGDGAESRRIATRLYLDEFEPVEILHGSGGEEASPLAERIAEAEETFHALMGAPASRALPLVEELRGELATIRRTAPATVRESSPLADRPVASAGGVDVRPGDARTDEIAAIIGDLDAARDAFRSGERPAALSRVEQAYLEGLEPLEPRLPGDGVRRAERLIHLELRPLLAGRGSADAVERAFAELDATLLELDAALATEASFWMGAASSFAIILREGLEAVLLIGAILATLGRVSDDPRHRRQVWGGVGLGVAASLATWAVARTAIPVSGSGRELIEGITALLAVAVLLYVSHWLFRRSYLQDWKAYLREKVGTAVTAGSSLAMAGLAFAAVYREGFETVLFYQALLFDAGAGAVLAGFLPGMVVIVALGVGVIRVGMRLPLGKVFSVTNAILLYLAFVFLGKGIYALQEAGLFSPTPVAAPDHGALRQLLGFYPIAETIGAQLLFLAALAGTWVVYRRRREQGELAAAP